LIDLDFPSAKIICHSKAPNGEELITFELEFHRFILSELNTHRSFSRNAQSSRAVPIEKMIEQVRNNPAMPVHWGKNQAGMVAEKELDELVYDDKGNGFLVEGWWRSAAKSAANYAEAMSKAGYHKQIVNRILEPFMKTKGVVTATKDAYEAFFKLRCHKDAQPEIKLLAERMQKALNESIPNELNYGEYHLPYLCVDVNEMLTEDAVKISCSCTAQVSYRRLDDSLDKALKVYDMLNLPVNGVYPEDPPHYSPTEHVAKVMEDYKHESFMSGNFHSGTFWQYRKALEMGLEDKFLEE
jgi:thymidylate synthase ThyX